MQIGILSIKNAFVYFTLAVVLSACNAGTEISSFYADKIAPEEATSLLWQDYSSNTIAPGAFQGTAALYASWTPSTSSELASQKVQLYVGASCAYPVGSPAVVTSSRHRFTGLADGTYSFKVLSLDSKGNTSYSGCSTSARIDHTEPSLTVSEAPTYLISSNQSSYLIRGTCMDAGSGITGNVTVKVRQGSTLRSSAVPCNSGQFEALFDLTGVFVDGAFNISVSAADALGSVSEIINSRMKDFTLPSIAINSGTPLWINLANRNAFPVSGTCTDSHSGTNGKAVTVTMTDGSFTTSATANCLSGVFNVSLNTTAVAFSESVGSISITATVSDYAGNSKNSASITVSKDTVAPVLSILSPANGRMVKGNSTVGISFSLTEANATSGQLVNPFISIAGLTPTQPVGTAITAGPLVNALFTQSVITPNTSVSAMTVKLNYSDPAGNPASEAMVSFIVDADKPTVTMFQMNGSSPTTDKSIVSISLAAADAFSNLSQFCLKSNNSNLPASNDSCWVSAVSPVTNASSGKTIIFNAYQYQLGLVPSNYIVYAWAKDEAGNISELSSQAAIVFDPGTPPDLINVTAVNTASSPSRMVSTGSNITVSWSANDAEGLAVNPISIYYTTNDIDYIPFSGSVNIANAASSGCTIAAGQTGCKVLAAPTSSYFKVRVFVKDQLGSVVAINALPMNDNKIEIIAGNLDDGLGSLASRFVFEPWGKGSLGEYAYKNRLAIADDGTIFYAHVMHGLLTIDPKTGVISQFIKNGIDNTGNNVSVAVARVKSVTAIAMDYSNNLLIYDFDRIRKIDRTTNKITTLIGGGSMSDPSVAVPATSIALGTDNDLNHLNLVPMPNGDLYFSTNKNKLRDRKYIAPVAPSTVGTVAPIDFTGTGMSGKPIPWDDPSVVSTLGFGMAFNLSDSSISLMVKGFDVNLEGDYVPHYSSVNPTSYSSIEGTPGNLINGNVVTGMDGALYLTTRYRMWVKKYNPATNSMVKILGAGGLPSPYFAMKPCADGTPALACKVDVDSIYVTKTGKFYFIDQGLLRTIDQNGNVMTVYGESVSTGSGVIATNSRFGDIVHFKLDRVANSSRLVVLDGYSNEFRDVSLLTNGTVDQILDNNGESVSACFQWHGPFRFDFMPGSSDIVSPCGTLSFFSRDYASWYSIAYGDTNPDSPFFNPSAVMYHDPSADGKYGNDVDLSGPDGFNVSVLGVINDKILYLKQSWDAMNGKYANCMVKQYELDTNIFEFKQSHFMGNSTCDGAYQPGAPMATNSISIFGLTNIEYEPTLAGNKYLFLKEFGQTVFKGDPSGVLEVYATLQHPVYNFTHTYDVANGVNIYYCASGSLFRYNKNNNATTQLQWGSSSLRCTKGGIEYDATINSLYIPVESNGNEGIARYQL